MNGNKCARPKMEAYLYTNKPYKSYVTLIGWARQASNPLTSR